MSEETGQTPDDKELDETIRVFRPDTWPTVRAVLWVLGGLQVFCWILIVQDWISNGKFPQSDSAKVIVAGPLIAILAAWALSRRPPKYNYIIVNAKGIRAFTKIGEAQFVHWEDIELAMVGYSWGIPHVAITVTGRRAPLVVPIWIVNFQAFVKTIEAYAGESNVLTQVLHTIPSDRKR
ncbi:MAG: hypothetical protein JST35_12575 [Armatimonadetes bacterium]|nr:hypothetical protein [Armatimonadota bacterium]